MLSELGRTRSAGGGRRGEPYGDRASSACVVGGRCISGVSGIGVNLPKCRLLGVNLDLQDQDSEVAP